MTTSLQTMVLRLIDATMTMPVAAEIPPTKVIMASENWELCCGNAALDDTEIQHVYSLGTERAKVAMDCNMHARNVVRDLQKQPGLALADPVAMAVALDKTMATKCSMHYVDVSCEGITRGMTVVDQLDVTGTPPYSDPFWADKQPNIEVCWELDVARWKEMLYKTLK